MAEVYSSRDASCTTSREFKSFLTDSFSEILAEASSESWEPFVEKNGVFISRKSIKGSPINCMKGTGIVHASPEEVFETVHDIQKVMLWDRILLEAKTVKSIDDATNIVYMAFKGKFPVAPRDFCLACSYRKDADGKYVQIVRSVYDEEVPVVPGFVRAKLLTSGFIITPYRISGRDRLMSLVTYIVQFDPKGWLPTFVANKLAEYHPLSIARIRSFLSTYDEQGQAADEIIPLSPIASNERKSQFDKQDDEESSSSAEISLGSGFQTDEVGIEDDSDDDVFEDSSNEFTNLSVSTSEQFNECLVAIQRELSSLGNNLNQSQRRTLQLEHALSIREHKGTNADTNQPDLEGKMNNMRREFTDKLNKLSIIQRQQELAFQAQEEKFNAKLKLLTNKVSYLEVSAKQIIIPLSSWPGKLVVGFMLLVWPWASYKLLYLLRTWARHMHKGHLLSIVFSVAGWLIYMTKVLRKTKKL